MSGINALLAVCLLSCGQAQAGDAGRRDNAPKNQFEAWQSRTPSNESSVPKLRRPSEQEQETLRVAGLRMARTLVLLVIRSDGGPRGDVLFQATGFVISKQHRLVATAAHVADFAFVGKPLLAFPEGTARAYGVKRVYYHPRMERELDIGLYVKSTEPRLGMATQGGPDVAVLQLASDGPELPEAATIATTEEFHRLLMAPVGVLGYPADRGCDWPTAGHPARATGSSSLMGLATDTHDRSDVAFGSLQRLWLDHKLGVGTSGAPIFNQDGHVVGLVTSGLPLREEVRYSDAGFRADCLMELLAFHHLKDSPTDKSPLDPVPVGEIPDPRLPNALRAVRFVKDARALRGVGKYDDAKSLCDLALQIEPSYVGARLERAWIADYRISRDFDTLRQDERQALACTATHDAFLCVKMFDPPLFDAGVCFADCLLQSDFIGGGSRKNRELVVRFLDDLLRRYRIPYVGDRLGNREQSAALIVRANAKGLLGQSMEALVDFQEAIEMDPDARWFLQRADFEETLGMVEDAKRDRESARRIEKGTR